MTAQLVDTIAGRQALAAELLAGGPAPKRYTLPTPGLATLGPQVGTISTALGAPFMPWQRLAAQLGSELHPTRPGWRYRLVILTVPRQAGKTTLLRSVRVQRCLTRPGIGAWMTAQTGKDARKRWRDVADAVNARTSPLAGHVREYKSAGAERLIFPNASFIAPFSPVPKSLHGETPELVDIDEAWAYDEEQGQALMAAIRPAQLTLPWRQLWVVSTRGTASSVFLDGLLAQGLASLDDPDTEIAYIDYSADETLAETDPTGADTLAFHPALGYTQQLDDLVAEYPTGDEDDLSLAIANYRRGVLNLPTVSTRTVTDLETWDELGTELDPGAVPWARAVVTYAVAESRAGATIAAGWTDGDRVQLAQLATGPGAAWVPGRLHQLRAAGARTFAADSHGATRTVTESPAMAGVNVDELTTRDYATACGVFLGRIKDRQLAHDDAPELRDALEAATLRPMAGGQGFDDRTSNGPIDAARAAAVACLVATRDPGPQLF